MGIIEKGTKIRKKLLSELEGKSGNVTVITHDISGNEKRMVFAVENIIAGLKNQRMTNVALCSLNMRFEW